jgi:hypothetical protein
MPGRKAGQEAPAGMTVQVDPRPAPCAHTRRHYRVTAPARIPSARAVTRAGRVDRAAAGPWWWQGGLRPRHDAQVKDWVAWHAAYDDPASPLSARLRRVRSHLSDGIDQAPTGRVSLVSLCAGQGHDVIGVLPHHPRRDDVRAVLVEADERNAGLAHRAATGHGLSQVEVRQADAGLVASFADALPADVLLLCGIFGNVSDRDIQHTVQASPALCRPGATVIWTRHRRPPDLTPQVRAWFADSGFEEIAFEALQTSALTSVGVNRLRRPPTAEPPGHRLFTFRSA